MRRVPPGLHFPAAFVLSATLSALFVMGVRRLARGLDVIDRPIERSLHTRPVPSWGGLGVFAALMGSLGIMSLLVPDHMAAWGPPVWGIPLVVVGAVDDWRRVDWKPRLAIQVVCASAFLASVAPPARLAFWGFPHHLGELGWVAWPLGVAWLVGFANSFNFKDGLDGLISSHVVLGGLGTATLAWLVDAHGLTWLSLFAAGAAGGFLLHNRPPARIFLGDSGSPFLGFVFGAVVIELCHYHPGLWLPLALIWLPVVGDAALTLGRRGLAGKRLTEAHREHLYQRLSLAGVPPERVLTIEIGLGCVCTGSACWVVAGASAWWLLLPVVTFGLYVLAVELRGRQLP